MKNKGWIASGLAFSIIASTLTATASFITRPAGKYSWSAPNALPWGQWSNKFSCPVGSYVGGYSMRVEPPQGRGDDTALNAIALHCYDRGGYRVAKLVPHPGIWGNWGREAHCPPGTYARGFQLKVEPLQGTGDDTGANSLKFICGNNYDFPTEIEASGGGTWGNWHVPLFSTGAICAVRVKFERHQGGRDDTALNDVEFFWCDL